MKPPVRTWSFSALKDFEACPHRVYLKRVERAPEPEIGDDPNHPLTRGNRLHLEAENFIKGTGAMTRGINKLEAELEALRSAYTEGRVEVEQKWGFTQDWSPCEVDYKNPDFWAIVICDAVEHLDNGVLRITDWKSGKSFGNEVKHTQQLQLYALAGFMKYPEASIITARLGYLDEGKFKERRYPREIVTNMLPTWDRRAKTMTNALIFKPKPNKGNCRWCPFGRNVGTGACAYSAE